MMYCHGEASAARAVLPTKMHSALAGPPPGDPEEGWEIAGWFYVVLQEALSDPLAALCSLRRQWLGALGEGDSTAYPSRWVLAGTLVEALTQCRDTASAALAARISVQVLPEPEDAGDWQIRAHLTEMSADQAEHHPLRAADRVDELLDELVQVVLTEPGALDVTSCRTVEGLLVLSRAVRHGPRIQRTA